MAIESKTIGEFITECYAYPYSKDYFELCKESFQYKLRDMYMESLDYHAELTENGFCESGAVSDPDYFLPYNESVFMEEKEKKEDDLSGPAILVRIGRWFKKILVGLWNALKRFFVGTKKKKEKAEKTAEALTTALADENKAPETVQKIAGFLEAHKEDVVPLLEDKKAIQALPAHEEVKIARLPIASNYASDKAGEHQEDMRRTKGQAGIIKVIKKLVSILKADTIVLDITAPAWKSALAANNGKSGDGEKTCQYDTFETAVDFFTKSIQASGGKGHTILDRLAKTKSTVETGIKQTRANGLRIELKSDSIDNAIKQIDEYKKKTEEISNAFLNNGGSDAWFKNANNTKDVERIGVDKLDANRWQSRITNQFREISNLLSQSIADTLNTYMTFQKCYTFVVTGGAVA